jgi:hypothetical protein
LKRVKVAAHIRELPFPSTNVRPKESRWHPGVKEGQPTVGNPAPEGGK